MPELSVVGGMTVTRAGALRPIIVREPCDCGGDQKHGEFGRMTCLQAIHSRDDYGR